MYERFNVDDWVNSGERYEFDGNFDSRADADQYTEMRDLDKPKSLKSSTR